MKRKFKSSPKSTKASSRHPLVGVWVEEDDPIYTSPVVFTITAQDGRFSLSGVDESDGVALRISNISWDGERLRFVSLFPPTKHKATHVFSLIRDGRAAHHVSYSDEDGIHSIGEVWKRVPSRSIHGQQ